MLGGGLGSAAADLCEPLRERLTPLLPVVPRVVLGALGSEAAIAGAVRWACERAQAGILRELQAAA